MTDAERLLKATRQLIEDSRELLSHSDRECAELAHAIEESKVTIAETMRLLENATVRDS
jgi:hypothetical protein